MFVKNEVVSMINLNYPTLPNGTTINNNNNNYIYKSKSKWKPPSLSELTPY